MTRRLLDAAGLIRATVESIAENTSDAQVAPLLWAVAGGVPGVLGYRAVNTLDAMIGHRSPRYARFGWAAARLDDAANYAAARVTAALTVVCAPIVGGSPSGAVTAWRRDAGRHPSPNAGVVEAAFAGALGVQLGGPTQYHYELQIRPALGAGLPPTVTDLRRAVRLSRAVQAAAALVSSGSAPPSVAVGELVLDGRRASGCLRRRCLSLFGAACPHFGVHEVAQQDRRDDAEGDPLDAVGQERTRVQVGQADDAQPAGLIVDQLQIRPGQRNSGQRGDLTRVDRIHLSHTITDERLLVQHRPLGVAQARRDGHRPAGRLGDRRYPRTR